MFYFSLEDFCVDELFSRVFITSAEGLYHHLNGNWVHFKIIKSDHVRPVECLPLALLSFLSSRTIAREVKHSKQDTLGLILLAIG